MLSCPTATTRPSCGAFTIPVTAMDSPSGSTPVVGMGMMTVPPATTRASTSAGTGAAAWAASAGFGLTVSTT